MKNIYLIIFFIVSTTAYIELQLNRIPSRTSKINFAKSQCQDPSTVSNQTKNIELCYEKDITYSVQFQRSNSAKYMLALDLTTPISWIKGDTCKIVGTSHKCQLFKQTLNQKLKSALRHKVTELIQKLKMKIVDDQSDNEIIEGSNEIVMGSLQKVTNLSVVAKNTEHVSHLLDVIMLGLFIIGQNDNITLNQTTFIRAHEISSNLDSLCDGAISLRFDQNSQNSFLNELFKYLNSKQKIISIYLGQHSQLATIGSYSPIFLEGGIASLKRIKIEQDEKLGKLARIQGIIIENKDRQDNNIDVDSSVIFTLSSSFVAFPAQIMARFIDKFITKPNTCKITNYLECSFKNKKDLQHFLQESINLDFETSIVSLPIKDLVLHREDKKVTFNLKESSNNYTILGEPFFLKYYAYFDYAKNEIGYGQRALSIDESIIKTVTLIHAIVLLILFALCFVLSSDRCKRVYESLLMKSIQAFDEGFTKIKTKYRPVGNEGNELKEAKGTTLEDDIQGI